MDCLFNILDQLLPGAAPGGYWTYIGWNATDPNGPWTTPPSGDIDVIGSNPVVNSTNWDVGIHLFSYHDECNPPQLVKYWKKEPGEAGTGTDLEVCNETTQTVDLNNQITGNTTGNWSVSSSGNQPPAGDFDANTGVFSIDSATPPGDYIFVFTAAFDSSEPDFSYLSCKTCTDTEQVTITVTAACDAGTGGSFGISQSEGSFNLYDLLGGTPEQSITWSQTAGEPVSITGGYLGTINLDAIGGCSWEFTAECGAGACGDSAVITITRQENLGLEITESGGDLTATHPACTSPSYQWEYDSGNGRVPVGTTQTISTQGPGTYYVTLKCDGNCSATDTYTVTAPECENESTFTIDYDDQTDCIDVVPNDTGITSPIDTDVWEYSKDGGAYQTATFPICDCDILEYLDVELYCIQSGNDFKFGYNQNNDHYCQGPNSEIDDVWVVFGDGTQQSYVGYLESLQITVNATDLATTYNGELTFTIRLDTPLGDLFQDIKITYSGNGGTALCSEITITKLNQPKIYRDISIRRTIEFTDGCPGIIQVVDWNPPAECYVYVRLIFTNTNGNNTITASTYNTGDCAFNPTFEWYLDGSLLAGETGNNVNRDTYGYGTYTVVVSCNGCTSTSTLVYQPPCDASVSITESGGVLTANTNGCGGNPITYEWDEWNGTNWVSVGANSSTYTPANNGLYRVIINCGGCTATAQYEYSENCTAAVTINNPSGTNMTTTVTGCGGAGITYEWYKWNGTNWVFENATGSSYDPGANGNYLVIIECAGCTALDTFEFACNVTAIITDNGDGSYTASQTGCSGSFTVRWDRSTNGGSTWNFYSDSITISNPPTGLYRLTIICDDGCEGEATINITGCSLTSVNITVNGNTLEGSQSGCSGTVDWLWEFWNGSQWVFEGSTQNITAGQNGDYRLTVTCGNDPTCQLSQTVTYTGECTNTLSVSYDAPTDTITATTSGCSGNETIQWQYSPNGSSPNNCPGGGWQVIANGVYSISPSEGTGCYRAIIQCDGVCPKSETIYVESASDCDGLALTYNSPEPNVITYGELTDGGAVVTNYLISWVDDNDNEIFKSAAGSFYDPNNHFPHPGNNIIASPGGIRPIILDSDVGTDLDCFTPITIEAYGCANELNYLSYDGVGGVGATTQIEFEVDGSTDAVMVGLRAFSVGDTLRVLYNGVELLNTGNQTNNSWKYWRVPYTYQPGVDEMILEVTNNTPAQNTRYDLYARCCDGGTCDPVLPAPTVTYNDQTCQCIISASSFGQGFIRDLCLTVGNYGGGGTVFWNKEAGYSTGSCLTGTGNCEAGTADANIGASSGTLELPGPVYTEIKNLINGNPTADCFLKVFIYSDAVCGGDGLEIVVTLPIQGVTYSFDDPTNTITVTIGANPYDNTDPCSVEARRHEEWEKVKNQVGAGGSAKFSNGQAYNPLPLNNNEAEFTVFIDGECGMVERNFKLTFADANCACESWQLREDTNGDGTYDTLIEENPNWTGTCS